MSTPTSTPEDVIKAAMTLARHAAEGALDAATLDRELADELRRAFGLVVGPGDALWPLQVDVARQTLALSGIASGIGLDELREWVAVLETRQQSAPESPQTPLTPSHDA